MRGAKLKHGKQLKGKAAKRNAKKEARSEKTAAGPGKKGSGSEFISSVKGKPKLTAQRRRDVMRGHLRFEPVVFVPAEEAPRESFDVDSLAEGNAEPEMLNGTEEVVPQNKTPVAIGGPHSPESSETSSSCLSVDISSDGSSESEIESEADYIIDSTRIEQIQPSTVDDDVIVTNVEHIPKPGDSIESTVNSDDELLGTMDDAELDELIAKDIHNTRSSQADIPAQTFVDHDVDSDIDSISDYEGETKDNFEFPEDASGQPEDDLSFDDNITIENEVDSLLSKNDSEVDERLRITLDDYDLSDADSAVQDYMDNMSDLDDDQIFALASGKTKHRNVQDFEDMDVFDQYDEYDEYFDNLLGQGDDFVIPGKKKSGISEKKKLKRQAREAMHAVKFGKIPILWQRYPDEIHVREVLAEIRNFATQQGASLAFPPLDNNANWYVKELALEHGMNPTVEGSNLQKYVVAHRTRRSSALAGKGINKLLTRRQVFRRSDIKVDKIKKVKNGAPVDVRVRHGHVVGQNASEISEENFGHRLMRQMGWVEGSGLGKEKSGIVAPIPATVKLTKTGLGGL